jgi:SAM-dependent methyltransferase
MNQVLVSTLVGAVAGTLASAALVRQCRKPAGWPGRRFARLMNSSHRGLTAWALGHIPLAEDAVILDVGCGGGATIRELAGLAPRGKVFGIDYSAASVAVACRTNAALIEAGRVDVRHGSVSRLPFGGGTFDVVTAVETHYYWPDLESDLREVRRVLRPGGRLAVVAESYRGKRAGAADAAVMRVLGGRIHTAAGHRDAFLAAGFTGVEVYEDEGKGWLCVVGTAGGVGDG